METSRATRTELEELFGRASVSASVSTSRTHSSRWSTSRYSFIVFVAQPERMASLCSRVWFCLTNLTKKGIRSFALVMPACEGDS